MTDAIDCVLTLRPLVPTDTSTPLAFQKRVDLLTNWSFGPSMKISIVIPLPFSSSR